MKLLHLAIAAIAAIVAMAAEDGVHSPDNTWSHVFPIAASGVVAPPVALSEEAHELTWDIGSLLGDHDATSSWTSVIGAREDKPSTMKEMCDSLREDLANKANITKYFSQFYRFSYLTRELPFGGDYTGMAGLRRFGKAFAAHVQVDKGNVEVYAVDEGIELCVLRTTMSGKWLRSGHEFQDVDHYIEIKAYDGRFVGGRVFDGMKGKEWVQSYRTGAQQRAYDMAADIYRSGYKSRLARRHLSHEAMLMMHPLGFSRYGPQVFKGKRAIVKAVDFVESVMKDKGGWRRGWEKEEDEDKDKENHSSFISSESSRREDDDDKEPDGRTPFPLPLPYMGHWCDIQYTNATIIAGFCIMWPGEGHGHGSHHRRHHRDGHGMSLFSSGEGHKNIPAPSGPTDRERMIGEMYVTGYLTYFNMRLNDKGRIDRIFIMPLQPNIPGYHGFRTHADTATGVDRGSTDDAPATSTTTTSTSTAPTTTTTTGTATGDSTTSTAVIARNDGRPPATPAVTEMHIMTSRVISAWFGEDPTTGEMMMDGESMGFVSILMAQGDKAMCESFSTVTPLSGSVSEHDKTEDHDMEVDLDKFDSFFGFMA